MKQDANHTSNKLVPVHCYTFSFMMEISSSFMIIHDLYSFSGLIHQELTSPQPPRPMSAADPVAPKAAEAAGAAEASNGADGAPEPCAPAAAATEGTTTATAQVCDATDFGRLKSLGTPRIGGFNTPYIYIYIYVVGGLEHEFYFPQPDWG